MLKGHKQLQLRLAKLTILNFITIKYFDGSIFIAAC